MHVQQPARLKHYEILSRLGEGGMGVVYRARDTRLGRTVALKTLPADLARNEERVRRFEREARIVSGLSHPGIATVYDFDRDGDTTFLTMELVEGPTLREVVSEGAMSEARVLECALQVAEALAAAHRGGVVHRDLKPENIMSAASGYYKVLDFGVARLDADTTTGEGTSETQAPTRTWATSAGSLVGTVAYMSPEQVRGEPTDPRSDMFSFGSVLYELISGTRAFRGDSEIATAHAVAYEPQEPLRSQCPDVSEGLELVVSKCLRKDPADRYASSEELVQDLRTLRMDSLSSSGARRRLLAGSPEKRPRVGRRAMLASILVAIAVAVAAAIGWAVIPRLRSSAATIEAADVLAAAPRLAGAVAPAALASRPRIVVAFFENNSGDPEVDWVTRGLPEMMTTELARSDRLDVIATQSLYDLLTESGREGRPELDRSTTAELARWAGADIVVSGSVFKAGDRYRIDAQAYDVDSGSVATADKVEGTDLFSMVNELTARLQDGLGMGAASPRIASSVTTDSPPALEAYLRGRELYEEVRFDEAAGRFREALRIDPDFELARLRLGLTLMAEQDVAEALPLLEQATLDGSGLSEPDRLLGQALIAYYRDGNLESGDRQLETLLERYPKRQEAYFWSARALTELGGSPMKAARKLRQSLALDPRNRMAMAALARQLAELGDEEGARRLLVEIERRPPPGPPAPPARPTGTP